MKFLYIEIDTNDADFSSELYIIDKNLLCTITPMIEAINSFEPYKSKDGRHTFNRNYPVDDSCREDLGEKTVKELYSHIPGFEEFDALVPKYTEYGTAHSISRLIVIEGSIQQSFINTNYKNYFNKHDTF